MQRPDSPRFVPEAGASLDDIMESYDGLDREQIKAVIEFAARSLDKAPAFAPKIAPEASHSVLSVVACLQPLLPYCP
jgi:Protein of unknown function (DUF433)